MIIPTVLLLSSLVFGVEPADSAWNAYLAGNFDLVEEIVFTAIKDTTLSDNTLARLYLALGCADAFRKRDAAATAEFEMALSLDPKLNLTEADLPPPVWKLYSPVRERIPVPTVTSAIPLRDTTKAVPTVVRMDTVRVFTPVMRDNGAVIRSLLYPGWGQVSEGSGRGWLWMGTETLLVTGWIVSALLESRAHDDYLTAREPQTITDRYDSWNNVSRLRQGFMYFSIAAYLAGQWDFFSSPPPLSPNGNGGLSVGFKL